MLLLNSEALKVDPPSEESGGSGGGGGVQVCASDMC